MYKKFGPLTKTQVNDAREKYGSNKVETYNPPTLANRVLESVRDPSILILIVALGVECLLALFGFAGWYEPLGIAAAVAIAISVSCISEHLNESRYRELLNEADRAEVSVVRVVDGKERVERIQVSEVVVGDVVLLEPGDVIPADGELVDGQLEVDTSSVTGESERKISLIGTELLRGYTVTDGRGVLKVYRTGKDTVYGRAVLGSDSEPPMGPLRRRLLILAQDISRFGYIGAILISALFISKKLYESGWHGWESVHNIVVAITLAVVIIVVAIPEGLPVMVAVTLARNMRRLLKGNVLVRQLLGIETAGSVQVLVMDKTGTLTVGRPEVMYVITKDGNTVEADKFTGNISGVLSTVQSVLDENGIPVGGSSIDRAILRYAVEKGFSKNGETTVPFTSDRKYSAGITSDGWTYVKGAFPVVVPLIKNDEVRVAVLEECRRLTRDGMRVVVVCRSRDAGGDMATGVEWEFVCAFALGDPVRDDAQDAVDTLRRAGVRVIVATGDVEETAVFVGRKAGIKGRSVKARYFTGSESIAYECTPLDKLHIIKHFQEQGLVVGMVGDGVNDVPAIRAADVGIALGSGAEAARSAAQIVILDDSIASISRLVLYGRTVYENIKKFLKFQLTVNVSAILVEFCGILAGIEMPLTLVQLLWINLIMDTLAATAFSGEPPRMEYMERPPAPKCERIVSLSMLMWVLRMGILSAIAVIVLGVAAIPDLGSDYARTLLFTFFVFTHNFNKFNCRTDSVNVFERLPENKIFVHIVLLIFIVQVLLVYLGGKTVGTVPLQPVDIITVFAVSMYVLGLETVLRGIKQAHNVPDSLLCK